MIKFKDKAFVSGVLFTPGMFAEFDEKTEAYLVTDGDAEYYEVGTGGTVQNAVNAQFAENANFAVSAQSAISADTATSATTATTAVNAITANSAQSAEMAVTATLADSATIAGHATTAGSATTAITATNATTADKASGLLLGSNDTVFPSLGKPIESIASYAAAIPCILSGVDERLEVFVIPAGTLGMNSILQFEPLWTFTSSANNKILKIKLAGVTIYSATRTTSVKESPLVILANRNSLKAQISPYDNNYATAGAGTPATYSINFSKDVLVEITGNRASTADTLKLEYYRVLHTIG